MRLVEVPANVMRHDLVRRIPVGRRFTDISGRQYGTCTIVGLAGFLKQYSTWLCKCECGNLFLSRGNSVFRGPSCGCRASGRVPHPLANTPTYGIYRKMIATRSRGSEIAPRWRSFANFVEDMGECPPDLTHVGRVDHDLPFRKDNCFYGTAEECLDNPRYLYTHNGNTGNLAFWAKAVGVTRERMRQRILRCKNEGLDLSEALTTPAGRTLPTLAARQQRRIVECAARRYRKIADKIASKRWGVPADKLLELYDFCATLMDGKVHVVHEEDWFGLDKNQFESMCRRIMYRHTKQKNCIHFRHLSGVMLIQSDLAVFCTEDTKVAV